MAKNRLSEMSATLRESSQWPVFTIANFAYTLAVCFLALVGARSESHVNQNTCVLV